VSWREEFWRERSLTMGLDTSHGCWHGSYGRFYEWRKQIAATAGLPPLELMDGFFQPHRQEGGWHPTFYLGNSVNDKLVMDPMKSIEERLPISWECLKPSPLHILLSHSDCDGEIEWGDCDGIADCLQSLVDKEKANPYFPHARTNTFISGLRLAYANKENVDFH